MKRICSAFLITLLLLVIFVPAFCLGSECTVQYTVNNQDRFEIPPELTLSVGDTELGLSLEAHTGNGYKVFLSEGGFIGNGVWFLTNSENGKVLYYTIKNSSNTSVVNKGELICNLNPEYPTSKIFLSLAEESLAGVLNGTYSGLLTFSFEPME